MRRFCLLVALVVSAGLVGCDGKLSGVASAAVTSAASTETAVTTKTPTTRLTYREMLDTYKNVTGTPRRGDGWDKKKADLLAKLGKPAVTEGDFLIWYGVGEPNQTCYRMKMSDKKGSELYPTDASKCGL